MFTVYVWVLTGFLLFSSITSAMPLYYKESQVRIEDAHRNQLSQEQIACIHMEMHKAYYALDLQAESNGSRRWDDEEPEELVCLEKVLRTKNRTVLSCNYIIAALSAVTVFCWNWAESK